MCCVTKATPIYVFYQQKVSHKTYKAMKSRKSCKTCLTNNTRSISNHIMPLVTIELGTDRQTDIYQHMNQNSFKKPGMHRLATSVFMVLKLMLIPNTKIKIMY